MRYTLVCLLVNKTHNVTCIVWRNNVNIYFDSFLFNLKCTDFTIALNVCIFACFGVCLFFPKKIKYILSHFPSIPYISSKQIQLIFSLSSFTLSRIHAYPHLFSFLPRILCMYAHVFVTKLWHTKSICIVYSRTRFTLTHTRPAPI